MPSVWFVALIESTRQASPTHLGNPTLFFYQEFLHILQQPRPILFNLKPSSGSNSKLVSSPDWVSTLAPLWS